MSESVVLGFDDSQLDAAFLEAENKLNDVESELEQTQVEIESIEEQAKIINDETLKVTRDSLRVAQRTAAFVSYIAAQSGDAANQAFAVAFEAAILTAETLVQIAAAESVTGFGAISAGLKLIVASQLFTQAYKISQAQEEESAELQQSIGALRLLAMG